MITIHTYKKKAHVLLHSFLPSPIYVYAGDFIHGNHCILHTLLRLNTPFTRFTDKHYYHKPIRISKERERERRNEFTSFIRVNIRSSQSNSLMKEFIDHICIQIVWTVHDKFIIWIRIDLWWIFVNFTGKARILGLSVSDARKKSGPFLEKDAYHTDKIHDGFVRINI